jgi:hypothetical protein
MPKRQLPDVIFGALLAVAIFALGFTIALSPFVNPATYQPAKPSPEQTSGTVSVDKPVWADPNWFIAFFSFCLAVVAVFQHRALKQANAVANQSTIIAEETRKQMFRTARRQLRAYIHIEKIDPIGKFSDEEAPILKIRFKNYGQTPAYMVAHSCGITAVFSGSPTLKKETFRYADLGPSQGRTTIFSTNLMGWQLMQHSSRHGGADLYLIGKITYFDAFQKQDGSQHPRITNYRVSIHEGKSGGILLSVADEGNEST